jgi:CRISPR/Cas system CSM-associated protein Csm4 (group 5 of RAMP superfamily)
MERKYPIDITDEISKEFKKHDVKKFRFLDLKKYNKLLKLANNFKNAGKEGFKCEYGNTKSIHL